MPQQATMIHDGNTYHRVERYHGLPIVDFYHLRVEADRDLDEDSLLTLSGLTGYAWVCTIKGERLGESLADTDRSVIFYADSTKSCSDDIIIAFEEFYALLDIMVREGSPVRKTNNAGPGTKGTRLIEGLDEDVKITLWVA